MIRHFFLLSSGFAGGREREFITESIIISSIAVDEEDGGDDDDVPTMQNDGAGQSQSNELVFIDQHNTVGLLGVQIITFIICAGIARIPYANAK